MAAIMFIGGMMMLMLGLIGEYIGRIYISINNSPQYVIREETSSGEMRDEIGTGDETGKETRKETAQK